MINKLLIFTLCSISISLFSMQPAKKQSYAKKLHLTSKKSKKLKYTKDQQIFRCLYQAQPALYKDLNIYLQDAFKALKNKEYEKARAFFLSVILDSQTMSQIIIMSPAFDEEFKKFFTSEIITLFEKAAALDSLLDRGLALSNLGQLYQRGLMKKKDKSPAREKDMEKAIHYYKLSAEQGNADGQFKLGDMYRKHNTAEALKLYRLSAEQGHPEAQRELGRIYEKGVLVARNLKEAVHWYRLAAKKGDVWAQFELAYIYDRARNYESAVRWYSACIAQGFEAPKKRLEEIIQYMGQD